MVVYGLVAMFSVDKIYDNFTKVLNDDRFKVVFDGNGSTQQTFDVFLATLKHIQEQECFSYRNWQNLPLNKDDIVNIDVTLSMPALESREPIDLYSRESQPFISLRFDLEFSHYIGAEKDFICWIKLHNYKCPYMVNNHLSSILLEAFFELVPPIYAWDDGFENLHDRLPQGYIQMPFDEESKKLVMNPEMLYLKMQTPWKFYTDTMIFGSVLVRDLGLDNIDWESEENIFYHKWVTPELLWISSHQGFKSIKLEEDPHEYFFGYREKRTRHIETMERLYDCIDQYI